MGIVARENVQTYTYGGSSQVVVESTVLTQGVATGHGDRGMDVREVLASYEDSILAH